jgi:hypothetical protein
MEEKENVVVHVLAIFISIFVKKMDGFLERDGKPATKY